MFRLWQFLVVARQNSNLNIHIDLVTLQIKEERMAAFTILGIFCVKEYGFFMNCEGPCI